MEATMHEYMDVMGVLVVCIVISFFGGYAWAKFMDPKSGW